MGATLWAGGSFIPRSPSCPRTTRSIKTETILCFKSSNLLSKIPPPRKHWKYKQKLLETWCQKFTRILCDKRPRDSNILAIPMKGNTVGQLKKKSKRQSTLLFLRDMKMKCFLHLNQIICLLYKLLRLFKHVDLCVYVCLQLLFSPQNGISFV